MFGLILLPFKIFRQRVKYKDRCCRWWEANQCEQAFFSLSDHTHTNTNTHSHIHTHISIHVISTEAPLMHNHMLSIAKSVMLYGEVCSLHFEYWITACMSSEMDSTWMRAHTYNGTCPLSASFPRRFPFIVYVRSRAMHSGSGDFGEAGHRVVPSSFE